MATDVKNDLNKLNSDLANRDPLTGEPGAHPIGTALGSAGLASTGAILGAAAGPVGSAAGAVLGAIAGGIVGGFAGSGIAELVNPTTEIEYWQGAYTTRPYVNAGESFETYKPAYKYGYDSKVKNPDRPYDAVRSELQSNWQSNKTSLDWNRAEPAVKDAYERTDNQYKQRLSATSGNASNNTGANQPGAKGSADSASRPGAPKANASNYGAGNSGAYGSGNKNNSGNNAA